MMEDYQDAVFAAYQKKLEKEGRAFALYNPTGTRIRKACLKIYEFQHTPKDVDILATYFNVDKLGADFKQILSKSVADDYRALSNHLKGITGSTDEKNSDLLAWLIDFQPRPSFVYYNNPSPNETVEPGPLEESEDNIKQHTDHSDQGDVPIEKKDSEFREESPEKEGKTDQTGQSKQESPEPKNPALPKRLIFIAVTLTLTATSSFFLLWKDNLSASPIKTMLNQPCMHWTGERYQLIDCNSEDSSTPIVAADTFKLAHMRKITRPDTLTRNALGKVWYVKIKIDSAEFYTDSGDYPLDTSKRLLPITPYMLNKYVFDKYAVKN